MMGWNLVVSGSSCVLFWIHPKKNTKLANYYTYFTKFLLFLYFWYFYIFLVLLTIFYFQIRVNSLSGMLLVIIKWREYFKVWCCKILNITVFVHDLHAIAPVKFDASHIIRHLSFGIDYPGKNYPLDGKSFVSSKGSVFFQNFLSLFLFHIYILPKVANHIRIYAHS